MEVSDDIIKNVMAIENIVYSPEYRGEFESIKARMCFCPQMLFLAYDGDEMIGYLCWIPVLQDLYESIATDGELHDDDVIPEQMLNAEVTRCILLVSVAVLPEYQRYGVATEMMAQFEDYIKHSVDSKYKTHHIVTCAVSDSGNALANYCGYTLVHYNWIDGHYNVYIKDLKNAGQSSNVEEMLKNIMPFGFT